MAKLAARPLTLVEGTPGPPDDPFIPEVAGALLSAGFPADLIPWLHLPAPAAVELSAVMGSPTLLEAARP
jgi:hypothetical protein